jgi:hypothetical protein
MAEREIQGIEWRVEQPLAEKAVDLQLRFLQVFGAGLDRLPMIFAGFDENATAEERQAGAAAAIAALGDIFVKGNRAEIMDLFKAALSHAQIRRPSGAWSKVNMNGDFTGNLSLLYHVVLFVLQEVLGPFFAEIMANLSQLQPPTETPPPVSG